MYDEFPGSSNGRKYGGEGDDSTINDEDEGVMRAGYTNNYGYGATEGAPPTDSENERGTTPNHYPGPASKVCMTCDILTIDHFVVYHVKRSTFGICVFHHRRFPSVCCGRSVGVQASRILV